MGQVSDYSYYSKISTQSMSTFKYQGTRYEEDRAMLYVHTSSLCQNCMKLCHVSRKAKSLLKSIMKQRNFYEFTSLYVSIFKGNSYLQGNLNVYWAFFLWVLLIHLTLFLTGVFWVCQKTHTLDYKYWMQIIPEFLLVFCIIYTCLRRAKWEVIILAENIV